MMNRVGSAGSFTAADHVKVLDAALAQVPAAHRRDVLVTVDGAGASHGLIEHLHELNTATVHGVRGRRLEYSIGWPVDARPRTAIEATGEGDWSAGLTATGGAEEHAQVVELTGLLRHSHTGDLLSGWPGDMRIFGRRTLRSPGEQAELGQDPNWRYGAFATNTSAGQVQQLDVRHRTQAHVEDRIKELKACAATWLPSTSYDRNSAWLHLAAHAVTVLAWLRLLALEGDLAVAEPKALRFRLLSAPARYVRHARTRVLKIPTAGPGPPTSPTRSTASARCTRRDVGVPVHPPPSTPEQWNPAPTRADRPPTLPAPAQDAFPRSTRRPTHLEPSP